ncbi:MAG: class I SAM-dependent methyltransferase [Myxococcota bacterium]|jgi:ubiquinone/menaquinone biosynthesis C-methylase UbiE|nr:class I SAM-dependent methyltransferase [Myxococcota bacterium]
MAREGAVKSNEEYYDEFAAWYENKRHDGYHAVIDDLEFDLLREYARGADVLEVGCGTGLILEKAAEVASSAHGVDISDGMLEQARARGLTVQQADAAEALPFEDESFDLVYSFKVLAHIEDIDAALQEMARVTRRGGYLLLEFYNPWSLRYLAKRVGGPQRISKKTRESAVYTRWDSAIDLSRRLPENLEVLDFAGVRIFTPAAFFHKLPVVRGALRKMEFFGRDSVFKYFGGFLVVIAQRR